MNGIDLTGTGYRFRRQRAARPGGSGPSSGKNVPPHELRAPWLLQTMVIGRFLVTSARYLGARTPLPAPPDDGHETDLQRPVDLRAREVCAPDGFEDTQPGWYGTT